MLVCTMTGHNHYTMCAQFHPKDNLIVSASLDQSVRVWDISGLRKKHSAPSSMSFEDQMARSNANQADMFGNTDAVVKFVLEGHDRGVNWVAFHPTLPLIVSAGDDRLIKLWRMSETKAWEVDTCRGHYQNVSACLFHPHQDLILSVGEDKTVRVWDLNKRSSVQSFKRENDRFWVIAAHPEVNLFAAGHDNGVMVFKLERERPASALYQNQLFFIRKDRQVRSYDFSKNLESPSLLSLRKFGNAWIPPRTLSYNPAEHAILVTSPSDNGIYQLVSLPRDSTGASDASNVKQGSGNSAVFVARNRFAVFSKATQLVEIKDLSNSTTKSFKAPSGTNDIYFGGTGCLLLIAPSAIVLYDVQQKKQVAEVPVTGVKYVSWSNDGLYAALLSKHNVTIVNKSLEIVSTLHETIRIKSATWDDAGVLLYSTLNHIKYSLLNGDNGIVKTLDQTVYLARARAKNVCCLDRAAKPRILTIDPTEYRFKLALVKRNYDEMLQIIKTSSLVGQSIISYLQKKGYPEIALQFVQDPQTRFELAIECGNLDVAVEMAKQLDRPKIWNRLGSEALSHGNHQLVEMSYQKLRNFDKLSFLYLCTGNTEKIRKMTSIAEHRGDFTSYFQNALYLGDVENRIQMFKEVDLYPLAYLTAKSHSMSEECKSILDITGMAEEQISLPNLENPGTIPGVIVQSHRQNWPKKPAAHSSFEKALAGEVGLGDDDEDDVAESLDDDRMPGHDVTKGLGLGPGDDDDGAEDGWDMGDDIQLDGTGGDEDYVDVDSSDINPAEGTTDISEADSWSRFSPLAVDHIAGGKFDSAMQLLSRQVGAINFAPLKQRFMEIYVANKTYLPASTGLPALVNHVRRNGDEKDNPRSLPQIPRDLETIAEGDLQEGYNAMRTNRLGDGVTIFQHILRSLLVNVVGSQAQVEEAKSIITKAAAYILAMRIELARRDMASSSDAGETVKRQLELNAYFTVPHLEIAHRQLALTAAMKQAFSKKQFASSLSFANKIIANGGAAKLVDNVGALSCFFRLHH